MKNYFLRLLILLTVISPGLGAQCTCGGSLMLYSASPELQQDAPGKKQGLLAWSGENRFSTIATVSEITTDPVAQLREISSYSLLLQYGFTERFSASVQQPYLVIHSTAGSRSGIGDGTARINYMLPAGCSTRLLFSAGIKFPSGNSNGSGASFVTGTGSWDPLAAAALEHREGKTGFRFQLGWRYATTGAEGLRFGNQWTAAAFAARPFGGAADSLQKRRTGLAWHAGLSGELQAPLQDGPGLLPNTGSATLRTEAGLTFTVKKISIPLSIGLPLWHEHKGVQSTPAWLLRMGILFKIH